MVALLFCADCVRQYVRLCAIAAIACAFVRHHFFESSAPVTRSLLHLRFWEHRDATTVQAAQHCTGTTGGNRRTTVGCGRSLGHVPGRGRTRHSVHLSPVRGVAGRSRGQVGPCRDATVAACRGSTPKSGGCERHYSFNLEFQQTSFQSINSGGCFKRPGRHYSTDNPVN